MVSMISIVYSKGNLFVVDIIRGFLGTSTTSRENYSFLSFFFPVGFRVAEILFIELIVGD